MSETDNNFWKIINKNKTLASLILSLTIGCSSGIGFNIAIKNRMIDVSDTFRNSIYFSDNNLKSHLEKINLDKDPNVRIEILEDLKRIQIDALVDDDLDVLSKYCHNLEELEVLNADALTDRQLNFIKELNIKNIRFIFRLEELFSKKLDLDILKEYNIDYEIQIDCLNENTFEWLINYHGSIEKLKVLNADALTDYQLLILKKLDTYYINLEFNMKNLFENPGKKFNLESLNDKKIDISYKRGNLVAAEEVFHLVLYNTIKYSNWDSFNINIYDNYRECDLLKIRKLDNELQAIIDSFNFDESVDDLTKVICILNYVTKKIEYDSKINELKDNKDREEELDTLKYYYNEKPISSILKEDSGEVLGICCNYVALMNILCYKVGIESYYVNGYAYNCNSSDEFKYDSLHAWNILKINNKYFLIDPTFWDQNIIISDDYELLQELDNKSSNYIYESLYENDWLNDDSDKIYYYVNKNNGNLNIELIASSCIGLINSIASYGMLECKRKKKKIL